MNEKEYEIAYKEFLYEYRYQDDKETQDIFEQMTDSLKEEFLNKGISRMKLEKTINELRKKYDDELKKYGFAYKESSVVYDTKEDYVYLGYSNTKETGRLAYSWLNIILYEKDNRLAIRLMAYVEGQQTNIYFNSFEDLFEKLEELSSY